MPEPPHPASLRAADQPSRDAEAAFELAADQITEITTQLLHALPERGEPRTREGERDKAKVRWACRETARR